MTDIFAHIVITDTNTGEVISRDRDGWKLMAIAFIIGYNWLADRFNECIDSWNSEFDKTHPNHGDLIDNDEYHQFIMDHWQPFVDRYNNAMAEYSDSTKFIIDDLTICMVNVYGHKVGMQLVTE